MNQELPETQRDAEILTQGCCRTNQPSILLLGSALVNVSALTAGNFIFHLAKSDHYSPRRQVMWCRDLCWGEESARWGF